MSALATCLTEAFSDRSRLKIWGEESRKLVNNYSYTQTTQGLREALNHLGILNNAKPIASKPSSLMAS